MCGAAFTVPLRTVQGTSNSSGNFCRRPCYNRWLAQTPPESSRGRLWKPISVEVVRQAPFCAWCGTLQRGKRRLQVHHIIPYRLTKNNDPSNLIPLCPRCHKMIETATKVVETDGGVKLIQDYFATVLRFRQQATRRLLVQIAHERRSQGRAVAD
jgi:hypothetical protein